MSNIDVAIIGAGPYGLSLAAHLASRGIDHCVFGSPMSFWRHHMPPGRLLKSDGNASDLPAPEQFPISEFLTDRGVEFSAERPIPVENFHDYGLAFHDRLNLSGDEHSVTHIRRDGDRFRLKLDDGVVVTAKRVVVAIGIRSFAYLPEPYASLPSDRISHSIQYGKVDALAGRRVAVIGSGASAVDVAAALYEAGATATIVTRRAELAFHLPPGKRKIRHRIRRPDTGIGGGWRLFAFSNFPQIFHALPERARLHLIETMLGPAPGWFMRDKIENKVTVLAGMTTECLSATVDGVVFNLHNREGIAQRLEVDHVVAATGFKPDVRRLDFLDPVLIASIRTAGTAPALSRSFETSIPGLYMIGPVAAPSFGPVMRFVFGTGKTSAVLARHMAKRRGPVQSKVGTYAFAKSGAGQVDS